MFGFVNGNNFSFHDDLASFPILTWWALNKIVKICVRFSFCHFQRLYLSSLEIPSFFYFWLANRTRLLAAFMGIFVFITLISGEHSRVAVKLRIVHILFIKSLCGCGLFLNNLFFFKQILILNLVLRQVKLRGYSFRLHLTENVIRPVENKVLLHSMIIWIPKLNPKRRGRGLWHINTRCRSFLPNP